MCFFDMLLKSIVTFEELDPAKGHLCEVEYRVTLEAERRGVTALVAKADQGPVQRIDRSPPQRVRLMEVGGQKRGDQQSLHGLITV